MIPASDLTTAGSDAITVVTAGPGGGTTSAVTFTVNNPAPTTFEVSSTTVLPGDNGFLLTFDAPYKLNSGSTGFNLYTGDIAHTLNPNRAILITGPGGAIFGSTTTSDTVRFNAVPVSSTQLELIETGINHTAAPSLLATGTWSLTVLGGTSNPGVVQLSNNNDLDGNGDGTVQASDNYTTNVAATAPASTTAVVTIGDVIAGPGQTVTAPLVVSGNVSGLNSVSFQFPTTNANFKVTGITFSSAITGDTGSYNSVTGAGTFGGSSAFASSNGSPVLIGTVTFQIPGLGNTGTAPAIGSKTPIGFTVTSSSPGAVATTAVDGFQATAYLGDVSSAFGSYTGADVSALQLQIVRAISGYSEYKDLDPNLIADINKDGNVTGADVSDLQLRIVGNTSTTLPALPSGSNTGTTAGPDPFVFINGSALGNIAPGQTNVSVPIEINNTSSANISVNSADIAVQFDPSVLSFQGFTNGDVANGSDGTGLAAWSGVSNIVNNNTILMTASAGVGPHAHPRSDRRHLLPELQRQLQRRQRFHGVEPVGRCWLYHVVRQHPQHSDAVAGPHGRRRPRGRDVERTAGGQQDLHRHRHPGVRGSNPQHPH